ncbi:MAG: DUF411 domain-containing protein [Gemmatimonadetes bacterium]|nr:DUF411 domain-containing protein [Gemmatimonadota bacterium]
MSKSQKHFAAPPRRGNGRGIVIGAALFALALLAGVTVWQGTQQSRTHATLAEAGLGDVAMTVYKSPTCECCGKWIAIMRKEGFTIDVVDRVDMSPIKSRLGVPNSAVSCHTATIGDYVVEGHVPAADILRVLTDRPPVVGIAVPGMPTGSPGMDGPSVRYTVVSFDRNGELKTFAER